MQIPLTPVAPVTYGKKFLLEFDELKLKGVGEVGIGQSGLPGHGCNFESVVEARPETSTTSSHLQQNLSPLWTSVRCLAYVILTSLEAYIRLIDLPADLQQSLQVSSFLPPLRMCQPGHADKSQHLLPEQCYHALHRICFSLRYPNVRIVLADIVSW